MLYRLGSRFWVNETPKISERYSDQMQAVMKQKKLNAQNMTGTQYFATKGCATGVLRPKLSSWTYFITWKRTKERKEISWIKSYSMLTLNHQKLAEQTTNAFHVSKEQVLAVKRKEKCPTSRAEDNIRVIWYHPQ